jgi:hypothetical protein
MDEPQAENVSVNQIELTKTVELRFLVMIDDDVDEKWIKVLRMLGFEVWKTRTPVDLTEVLNENFAKDIKSNGVIGISELNKLEGLRIHAFQTVLFLDCDILFHKRFDQLLETKENYAWTVGAYPQERTNGGFLIYNPSHPASMHHLDNIIELLREGDFCTGGPAVKELGSAGPGVVQRSKVFFHSTIFMKPVKNKRVWSSVSISHFRPLTRSELDKCRTTIVEQTG